MWQPIEIAPRDGFFFAIGDEQMAVVWYEPEAGMRWKIRDLTLGGVRLGDNISVEFHSWCRPWEFREAVNRDLHPEYYLPGSEVLALEEQGKDSRVHRDQKRRYGR